ncbi:MAG: hypothetical protein RRZ24_09265 [Clostridia bacterium]
MSIELLIRTVTGDISSQELGWCQCHEHLFLSDGKSFQINSALRMDDEEKSVEELIAYKRAGGCSYVDAQPFGAGRMAEAMVCASNRSGVKIIASTGFHKTCFYKEDGFIFRESMQQLHERFVLEIQEGMMASDQSLERRIDAKAGMMKVAVDCGGIRANALYEKLFEAAVSAAAEAGVSIMAHFEKNESAEPLLLLMSQYGLAPNRLLACHLDRMRYDIGYHRELAATGVYLEYDTINRLRYHDNEMEIRLIAALLSDGWKDRLLLSLDTTNQRLRAYGAEMGLDYILTEFSALLQSAGITQDELYTMMVHNPSEALAFEITE